MRYLQWYSIKLNIHIVIGIMVCMSIGFISAVSTLKELRRYRANKTAFVLAELTLGVCALVFLGSGVYAYLVLQFGW